MKIKTMIAGFGFALVIAGLSGCASTNPAGSDVAPAASGRPTAEIALPDSLYCTWTGVESRLSVNLAPLRAALGTAGETYEVFLFRQGRKIGTLGKFGGGIQMLDFIFVDLPSVDSAVFNTASSVRFALKTANGAGVTVAERNIMLIMN